MVVLLLDLTLAQGYAVAQTPPRTNTRQYGDTSYNGTSMTVQQSGVYGSNNQTTQFGASAHFDVDRSDLWGVIDYQVSVIIDKCRQLRTHWPFCMWDDFTTLVSRPQTMTFNPRWEVPWVTGTPLVIEITDPFLSLVSWGRTAIWWFLWTFGTFWLVRKIVGWI